MKQFPNLQSVSTPEECQTFCGMLDDRTIRKNFVDLRLLIDDKILHRNPHKGWFWHYIDNGYGRGNYREAHDPQDTLMDFPGLNHLYLRFDWGDVEREMGVYDFSYLDEIMETWGKYGYRFSLRVCSYEGDANLNHATPAYVYEKGARCFALANGKIQPDYADPIFLYHLEKFMDVFGAKYNGDPRIECIDIGTIGTWGEGHTVEGDSHIYPLSVVKKHFDFHARYFPDTYILCNDDHIMGRMARGQEEVQAMLDYAYERGFGVQDDSICCDYYFQMNGYDTMRAPWAFEKLADNAPNAIEMAHYTYIKPHYESYFRSGFTALEAYKNAHATFAGFHGYPRHWLSNEYDLTAYCANRLGYWYFVTGAELPTLTPTAHNMVILDVENRGFARAYWRFDLKVRLKDADGHTYVIDTDCDNRTWQPNTPVRVPLKIDCRGIPAGNYQFAIGLFEGETPIKFALKDEIFEDNFYAIGQIEMKNI